MNFYLTIKREYKLAEYLLSVRVTKQKQILSKHRLRKQVDIAKPGCQNRSEQNMWSLPDREG